MRKGRGYPIEIDMSELYRLYVIEKMPPSEIAKKFDCSKSAITNKIKKFTKQRKHGNIPDDVLKELSSKMTVPEISEMLGVPQSSIYSKLKRGNIEIKKIYKKKRTVDHTQDERIKKMKEEGKTIKEICIVTGLSRATVFRRLSLCLSGKI